MKRKNKRRLKKILALGLLGAGAKMGLSKMAENRAIKESAMAAKPMFATKMNQARIPASVLNRKTGVGKAFLPKGNLRGQDFGLDPFGAGMGAKKGKMIKARGGRLARVKPTKMM
tara:strand:+ start:958 stop:1302 length:345 start_codon:yes stop_codon:yes gene_type:complete